MGVYRIEVEAVGGHGCQRNIKSGQIVQQFCNDVGCPDCAAREFVRQLKRSGSSIQSGILTHWPGTDGQVKDDLLTLVRTGNF